MRFLPRVADSKWRRLRARRVAIGRDADEPCFRCGGPIDWDASGQSPMGPSADHIVPVALSGEEIVSLDELAVAHLSCNSAHGARLGARLRHGSETDRRLVVAEVERAADREPTHSVPLIDAEYLVEGARQVEWDGPGSPPRLFSQRHPDAVGSLADVFEPWIDKRLASQGLPSLRHWQRVVLRRGLEVDAEGQLVWPLVVLTVGRQLGKSTLIRELALARMCLGAGLFGEPQKVLLVSRTMRASADVHRSTHSWAAEMDFKIWRRMDDMGLHAPGDNSFSISSLRGIYGTSVSMLLADEGWDISPEAWSDGCLPTMAAKANSQAWLTSTAHRDATPLIPGLRRSAAKGPSSDVCLMEWSIPSGVDDESLETFKSFSPFWDKNREKVIRLNIGQPRDDGSSIAEQFGNRWPVSADSGNAPGFPVGWDSCRLLGGAPPSVSVAAVESDFSRSHFGVALADVGDGDGVVHVWGFVVSNVADVDRILSAHRPNAILTGISLGAILPRWDTQGVGHRESSVADPMLQAMVRDGLIAHNHDPAIAYQAANARVRHDENGQRISPKLSGTSVAGIRAVSWAANYVRENGAITAAVW